VVAKFEGILTKKRRSFLKKKNKNKNKNKMKNCVQIDEGKRHAKLPCNGMCSFGSRFAELFSLDTQPYRIFVEKCGENKKITHLWQNISEGITSNHLLDFFGKK
jgi:hypothetical protein